jgi:nucleotide-binding universal stress UspA family protein
MTHITQILCPIDFSETSRHALEHAGAMARSYNARLTVLYVFLNLPTLDLPPLVLEPGDRERLLTQMEKWIGAAVPAGVPVLLRVQEAESVQREILTQADADDADLLVIGTHGRSGFQHLLLGSITEKVIRKARCPTLVVPPRAPHVAPEAPVEFRRILCPVDFSECSLDALAYAVNLAGETDARLTVLHVIELPPELRENALVADFDVDRIRGAAEREARRRLRDLVPDEAAARCTVETAVLEGSAYHHVLRQAAEERSDLIVMGVRGRGAMDLLVFGSTTHHVIRAAACPVLIVHGK